MGHRICLTARIGGLMELGRGTRMSWRGADGSGMKLRVFNTLMAWRLGVEMGWISRIEWVDGSWNWGRWRGETHQESGCLAIG